MKSYWSIGAICIVSALTSCHKEVDEYYEEVKQLSGNSGGLYIIYPYQNTFFPPEINAPTFEWKDSTTNYKSWNIYISDSVGSKLVSGKIYQEKWAPDSTIWEDIKSKSLGKNLQFIVIAERGNLVGKRYNYAKINFSVSKDSVSASIFYRAVPLPFSYAVKNVDEIEWYMAEVGDIHPKKMLDKIPICANCHSFPRDGNFLAMDVDYANNKGSYAIAPINDSCIIKGENIMTWDDYKRSDGEKTFGLLSQISPDGRYVLSTVKDRSVFVAIDENFKYSQLFFPVKGILVCYDRVTKKFMELQGACDKKFVQSNPSWSPDGQEIAFARNSRYSSNKIDQSSNIIITPSDAEEFITGNKDFKFNLYKLPFNNGLGGVPIPIEGASNNGKSNYFARYSPDGKWIVFCQANNFMLLRPDSRLYIVSTKGGTPKRLNCNMAQMNSWHSWSPNSKWLVFSSKNRGPYTQLYLTHIDEYGNDSPPVLLENMMIDSMAANIPEFYTGKSGNFTKIVDGFSKSAIYYTTNAIDNIAGKKYTEAYANLEKAIAIDSMYYDSYKVRIRLNKLLYQEGLKKYQNDKVRAIRIINEEIKKNPKNEQLLLDRAEVYLTSNEYEKAVVDAQAVLRINDKNYKAYETICTGLKLLKRWNESIPYYTKLLSLIPDNAKEISCLLVMAYKNTGNKSKAFEITDRLIKQYPSDMSLYINKAFLLVETGKIDDGIFNIDKAVGLSDNDYTAYLKRSELYSFLNNKLEAQNDEKNALADLNSKVEKNPGDMELLFVRADLLRRLKDQNKALNDYYTILKILPENYRALKSAALLEFYSRNWKSALLYYDTLRANYPAEVDFYKYPGLIYLQMKDKKNALDYLTLALNIEPDNAEILYNRAILFYELGEGDKANIDIQRVTRLLEERKKNGSITKEEMRILDQIKQKPVNNR